MAVEKLSDASKVYPEEIPFTQISNQVIEKIKDNDALRIWAFSLSKSRDWEVIKEFTEKICGVGQRKSKQVWSYLQRANLIEYVVIRNDKGLITGTDIKILNGSNFDPNVPFLAEKSRGAETAPVDSIQRCKNPPGGETARAVMYPLLNKDITNKDLLNQKEKEPSLDDFKTEENLKLCKDKNLNIEMEIKKYEKYYSGKNLSLNRFTKWLLDAKPEAKAANENYMDKYVRELMKETNWPEEQCREYYRKRGHPC